MVRDLLQWTLIQYGLLSEKETASGASIVKPRPSTISQAREPRVIRETEGRH